MKISVTIGKSEHLMSCRKDRKSITRAILECVEKEKKMIELYQHALDAGRTLADGLDGYHWQGGSGFHVEVIY